MLEFRTGPYQVWFPGKLVWELWAVDGKNTARLVNTCEDSRLLRFRRRESVRILALPAEDLVSVPFVTSAYNEKKLVAGAQFYLNQEAIRCDVDGVGAQPIVGLPPRTLARIDAPGIGQRAHEFSEKLNPTIIVPAAALLPLPKECAVIWEELRKPVMGFERDGHTVYYRHFEGGNDEAYAVEIRDAIKRMKSSGFVEQVSQLHLWGDSNAKAFRKHLSVPVVRSFRTDPVNLQSCVGVRPARYREYQAEKAVRKKRRNDRILAGLAISSFVAIFTAILVLSSMQTTQQRERVAKLSEEALRIEKLKEQWEEVAPAVDRNQSVLEVWRNVISLPSSRGIYVSRFVIGEKGVELNCQAESSAAAYRFVDEIAKQTSLAMFSWDYQAMEVLKDGTALFELKGLR